MKQYRKSSHTIYDIKYHICWITKYRYQVLTGKIAERARDLIRRECSTLDVKIITGSIGSDHVHIFVSAPPDVSVSKLMRQIKGVSSRKIQQEYPEIKKRYWGKQFWARGYFAVSSGNVTDETWMEYIRNQREQRDHDQIEDFQITSR